MIQLQDLVNWPAVLQLPRNYIGYVNIFPNLFTNCAVIADATSIQRITAYAYIIYAGADYAKIVLIYHSYIADWHNMSDDDVRNCIIIMLNNAHIFNSVGDAIKFLQAVHEEIPPAFDLYDIRLVSDSLLRSLAYTRMNLDAGNYSCFK